MRQRIWCSARRAAVLSCAVWLLPALGVLRGTALGTGHAAAATAELRNAAPPVRRWHREEVVVHVDASLDALGPQARVLVQRAFEAWSTACTRLPRMRFEHSDTGHRSHGPDGRNTVALGPIDFEGHRDDLAVAISYRNSHTGTLREVDIIINADKPWASFSTQETGPASNPTLAPVPIAAGSAQVSSALLASRPIVAEVSAGSASCSGNFDLLGVMTHEAGHFFGLSENTQASAATMYHTTAPCETQKRSLEPSDLRKLTEVYAPAASRRRATRTLAQSRRQRGASAAILLAWSLVWLLLGRLRLPRPDGRDRGKADSAHSVSSASLT